MCRSDLGATYVAELSGKSENGYPSYKTLRRIGEVLRYVYRLWHSTIFIKICDTALFWAWFGPAHTRYWTRSQHLEVAHRSHSLEGTLAPGILIKASSHRAAWDNRPGLKTKFRRKFEIDSEEHISIHEYNYYFV